MAYFDYENAMLERFRAKHRELLAGGAEVNLYAMVDPSALSQIARQVRGKWMEPLQRMPLYAGSGLDLLEATGPVVMAMPDLRNTGTLTSRSVSDRDPTAADAFVRLLSRAAHDPAHVTWIWTPHDMGALVEHLQTLLHARLGPDDEDAWFFFYQPSHLKVLHEKLPEATRRHMFGPIHAWWTLSLRGTLVELEGYGTPVPAAWDAFPVPADVVDALQRAAMPMQLHAWLQKCRLGQATAFSQRASVAELVPLVSRAVEYGLTSKADIATFVVYGQRYKVDYDHHPALQALLTDASTRSHSLARTYRDVPPDVWAELAQTAQQRIDAQAASAWNAVLSKAGQVTLRVRVVNCTRAPLTGVFFDFPAKQEVPRHFVGRIDGSRYSEPAVTTDAVVCPLPGGELKLSWIETTEYSPGRYMATPRQAKLIVQGQLPVKRGAGVLEIRIGKFGQTALMHKDGSNFDQAERGQG